MVEFTKTRPIKLGFGVMTNEQEGLNMMKWCKFAACY